MRSLLNDKLQSVKHW